MKYFFCAVLFFFMHATGSAQFYPTQYRPPDIGWQQLKTEHFIIIFPQGEDSAAWRTARILETQYPDVQQLTAGSLSDFPVILNNYNDRSNGFVTAFHFRSEIEIPPLKGKSLNPQSGNWLEAVEPHELVHALHFSNTGGFGLGGLVNLFSPDLARSLHGAIPSGITEGLATYYETDSVVANGGRGNYPYFYNRFNSIFLSPDRWSMGQTVHRPERSRPFDRHYMGGYEFTDWLHKTYGDSTSYKALNFYIDLPFLGYGVALKHVTGEWPGQLYDEFSKSKEKELASKRKGAASNVLPIPFEGISIRRAEWLDESTLIFFGSFYNARAGFYRYNLKTQSLSRLATTGSVEDYLFALSDDKSTLIYSAYRSSPIYDNTFKAELVEVDLSSGRSGRLTTDGRMYAPAYSDNAIVSLQTSNTSSRLVDYDKETGLVEVVADLGRHRIIQVKPNPVNPDRWAVIVNKRGMQALWIVSKGQAREDLQKAPAVSFSEGSVFDPSWHPDGNRLLLTSDYEGAMNIYEYDLLQDELKRITNTAFNAFEASYSPAGERIAFILQKENEQLPAVLAKKEFDNTVIDPVIWKADEIKSKAMKRPELGEAFQVPEGEQEWQQSPYTAGLAWLKPRTVVPVLEEIGNSYQYGASLHSSSVLQNQSYSLELTGFENRVWYDLSYRNTSFFPGFKARAFNEPSLRTLVFTSDQDTLSLPTIRQERSFAVSVPANIVFDRNVYFSSLVVEPEIRYSQIRYLDGGNGSAVSDFGNLAIGNLFASVNYRLQQNIRDIQPNTGLRVFGEAEHFFSTTDLTFDLPAGQASRSFIQPTGFRGGVFTYLSPLRKWNQSLRLSLLGVTQSGPVFDNQFLVSEGFSEQVFPASNNLMALGTRYTIPLYFADNGGFLVPLYLSNIYLVGFSNSVLNASDADPFMNSRTVVGGGVRMQFRLSNLSFDVGIGLGYEPTRNKANVFIGNF